MAGTKTTTNASKNTTEAPVTKKIDQAKALFDKIMDPKFVLPEGKSHRGLFMEQAMAEIGLSKSGANTYFQNLKNEAETGDRYKYAPKSTANTSNVTRGQVKAAEGEAVDTAQELHALKTEITKLNRTVNKLLRSQAQAA